jgi:hypothetical protein
METHAAEAPGGATARQNSQRMPAFCMHFTGASFFLTIKLQILQVSATKNPTMGVF